MACARTCARAAEPDQKNMRTPNAKPRPGSGARSLRNEVCARASSSSRLLPSRNTSHALPPACRGARPGAHRPACSPAWRSRTSATSSCAARAPRHRRAPAAAFPAQFRTRCAPARCAAGRRRSTERGLRTMSPNSAQSHVAACVVGDVPVRARPSAPLKRASPCVHWRTGRSSSMSAGVGEVDEVVEAHVVQRRGQFHRAAVPMHAEFGAVRGFRIERRLAEFDALRRHVHAVGIQLLGGRRALRAIQAEVDSAGRRWRSSAGRRDAEVLNVRSGPIAVACVDIDLVAIARARRVPAPASPNSRLPIQNRPASRDCVLGTNASSPIATKSRCAPLQAERAVPSRDRLVHEFQAAFGAVVVEERADFVAFEFGVVYSVCAELEPQRWRTARDRRCPRALRCGAGPCRCARRLRLRVPGTP